MAKRSRDGPQSLLHFEGDTLSLLKEHVKRMDQELEAVLNETIPASMKYIEGQQAAAANQSVQESQAAISQVFSDVAKVFDTVCHWIAMREEKLECGNEFGSDVQAAISSAVTTCLNSIADKKESLTTLLVDRLQLRVPKYAACQDSDTLRTLQDSYVSDYHLHYLRFLALVHKSYFRVLHILARNHASLVDPKNRQNLGHGHHELLFA
eukprot:GGOE01036412.1.p1 GENE.GGOE01036412.1~~GGOE01036412.1.p1  ORF type:complete len:222 (+),score=75.80 GGOE01036412.1:42-668(+)